MKVLGYVNRFSRGIYRVQKEFNGMYKPSGLNRPWPNVLNFEVYCYTLPSIAPYVPGPTYSTSKGARGLEQLKWSPESVDMDSYDVTIPFIRMVIGPMNFIQGAMRNAARGNYRPIYSEPISQGTRSRLAVTLRGVQLTVLHAVRQPVRVHAQDRIAPVYRLHPHHVG